MTDYLTQAGLRLVTAVRQRNREYLIALDAPEGVRHLILLPYVPGIVSRKPSPTLIARYGALVAELHRLTDALPEPRARPTYDAETLIVQSVTTLEDMTGYLESFLEEIRTIADRLYPLLQALPRTRPQFGIVHGDIIPSNALIGPDDTLTLIDFDLFGLSWRGYDIASYLNEIGFWQMGPDAARTFLDGYTSVRPLTEPETQTLPLMQIARHLASLATAAANVNTWGSSIYLSDRVIDGIMKGIRELSARLA